MLQNIRINNDKVGLWNGFGLASWNVIPQHFSSEAEEKHEYVSEVNRQSGQDLDRLCS
jgi:hypothetical protein